MKPEYVIIFIILIIYFKSNNLFTKFLNNVWFLKDIFATNYFIPILLFLIILIAFSSKLSSVFKKSNKVSGDDIVEEFKFVNDVRSVTSSGKIKQKELYEKYKEKVSDKQNNLCNHCGKRIALISEFSVDFIVPLSRGGNNNLANTQALCNACWENKNSIDKFLQ